MAKKPRTIVSRKKSSKGASTPLTALRDEIRTIDERIVELVGARLALAERIGRVKASTGQPIRDFQTEKQVRARAASLARRARLDLRVVESIFDSLIDAAVRVQEEIRETSYSGARQRVLIVGGRGKMGTWLAHFFHAQGHAVTTFDPAGGLEGFPAAPTLAEGLAAAQVAILATPLEVAHETLRATLALSPRALVADIFSLKSAVAPLIRDGVASGLRIASIHPLFGPDARLLAGRTLLVCETGDRAASRQIRAFFEPTALSIRDLSLESHDRVMAIVLGLSHAVNLIFSRALVRTGVGFRTLQDFGSSTFHKQVRTAAEVAAENPALYHAIQCQNHESGAALGLLTEVTREFVDAALDADPSAFIEEMNRMREWYEEPGEKSAPRAARRTPAPSRTLAPPRATRRRRTPPS
ncbi:MAG: prephenate dehydrogenase/arogenate dehydrogenase family protein [bacterium]